MSLFHSLPTDVSNLVINVFLDVKSIGVLDAASTTTIEREYFVTLLSAAKIDANAIVSRSEQINWLATRGIMVFGIGVLLGKDSTMTESLSKLDNSRIAEISCENSPSELEITPLTNFINSCNSMTHMHFLNFAYDSSRAFHQQTSIYQTIVKIQPSILQNLQYLLFKNCGSFLTAAFVSYLSNNCSHLDFLVIDFCEDILISEKLLLDIVKANTKLTAIHISNCCGISERFLKLLADFCPDISQVVLESCHIVISTDDITNFISKATKLNYFTLDNDSSDGTELDLTYSITNDCAVHKGNKRVAMSELKFIDEDIHIIDFFNRITNFSSITLTEFDYHFNDKLVDTIVKNSPYLSELILIVCSIVKATHVKKLISNLKFLKKLELIHLDLTNRDLKSLFTVPTAIETLKLLHEDITNEVLVRIITDCPKLKTLDIHAQGKYKCLDESKLLSYIEANNLDIVVVFPTDDVTV